MTHGRYHGVPTLEIAMKVAAQTIDRSSPEGRARFQVEGPHPRASGDSAQACRQARFQANQHPGALHARHRERAYRRHASLHRHRPRRHLPRIARQRGPLRRSMSVDSRHVEITSDAVLIERSLRQPEAFGEVFDRHWVAVYRYCRSRAGSDGEGLAADTFRLAFDRRAMYDTERADALPWLLGLATNLIRNHLRSRSRGKRALGRLDVSPDGRSRGCSDRPRRGGTARPGALRGTGWGARRRPRHIAAVGLERPELPRGRRGTRHPGGHSAVAHQPGPNTRPGPARGTRLHPRRALVAEVADGTVGR